MNNVDTLSTIALALAVLAFAAQLIVSLAQAQGAAHQVAQTERINSETQSALADVRSTAHALLSNQSEQFNRVLSAALRSATKSVVQEVTDANDAEPGGGTEGDGVVNLDPDAIAERIESRLRGVFLAGLEGPRQESRTSEFPAWADEQLNLPEAMEAMRLLESLSSVELVGFLFALYRGRSSRSMFRVPAAYPWTALAEKRVVRLLPSNANPGTSFVRLDMKSRLLGRLLAHDYSRSEWFLKEAAARGPQSSLPDL